MSEYRFMRDEEAIVGFISGSQEDELEAFRFLVMTIPSQDVGPALSWLMRVKNAIQYAKMELKRKEGT